MKNKNINLGKIKEYIEERKKFFIIITAIVLIVGTVGAAYLSLNPPENTDAAESGQKAVENLNIRFDTNMINLLSEETAPAVVNGQGGRNPFASY